jgi:hypothetical protein
MSRLQVTSTALLLGTFLLATNAMPSPGSGLISKLGSRDLAPADAPGVKNAIGRGQDPAPVKLPNGAYAFPDVDFGTHVCFPLVLLYDVLCTYSRSKVYLRVSDDLNNVQSDDANKKTVFTYNTNFITEAPDLCQWGDTWVIYVSQVAQNPGVITLPLRHTRLLIFIFADIGLKTPIHVLQSQSSDPLGPYNDLGNLKDAHGDDVQAYDAHCATGHPNGKNYFFQANLHSVSITELSTSSPTQLIGDAKVLWR